MASLTMSAMSSSFRAHHCMGSKKSAISLYLKKCRIQPRLARNQSSGQETRSDPCISSVTTSIMITTSNSSAKRSGLLNQLLDVLLHTIACSELARVRTELHNLRVIPFLAPHPIQTNGESPRHGDLGDLPAPTQHQVEILAAPFRNAACRNFGSFHQQEAQHRAPLLGDMPQSSPIPTRGL